MKINKILQNPIYYGAKPSILEQAKELRKNMTDAEKVLWGKLNKRQLCGFKFRRQHPLLQFVADFYCHEVKLIIEVDGGYHQNEEQVELDDNRTYELEQHEIKVIRFRNEDIMNDLEGVVDKIREELDMGQSAAHPPSPPNGGNGQRTVKKNNEATKNSGATSTRLSPLWGEMSKGKSRWPSGGVIFLLAILTLSCSPKMNREKLLTYLNNAENELKQEKTINGTTVALTYRPASLMAWAELNNADTLTDKKIQEATNNYNQHMYFVLSVSHLNREILSYGGNRQKFSQMVNRLAFGMGDYVLLTSAQKDTIPLADFHCPRMYGMAPSTDILLVFTKNESLETEYLQFKLSDLDLGTGDLKFRIDTKDIKKAEKIKLIY